MYIHLPTSTFWYSCVYISIYMYMYFLYKYIYIIIYIYLYIYTYVYICVLLGIPSISLPARNPGLGRECHEGGSCDLRHDTGGGHGVD